MIQTKNVPLNENRNNNNTVHVQCMNHGLQFAMPELRIHVTMCRHISTA